MSLVIANAFLIIMVLLEIALIYFYKKEPIPWREIIFNLNSGHILMWVLRGLELGVFHFVLTHWSFHLLDQWSDWSVWLFGFLTWDFCFYWLHRFHHKYRFLWAVHVVHHEGEHFSLSLGIRNSWYSSLTAIPFFVGLAFIGVPLEVFIATSSIHYIIQFYNHNNIVGKSGWLENIMITPAHHRVHHGSNEIYWDKNLGGTFVFWDKMFGTFQAELAEEPVIFGTKDYVKTENVVWANIFPFLKLFNWSERWDTPTQSAFQVSDRFISSGGILLFGLLLYYIAQEPIWSDHLKLNFFIIIFLGTIANGGISEGKYWGLTLWAINFLILGPVFLFSNGIAGSLLGLLLASLAIHSLITLGKVKFSTASF
ncbi:MAG: sterol desaturase family protein [Saprospiraceae bacterium]